MVRLPSRSLAFVLVLLVGSHFAAASARLTGVRGLKQASVVEGGGARVPAAVPSPANQNGRDAETMSNGNKDGKDDIEDEVGRDAATTPSGPPLEPMPPTSGYPMSPPYLPGSWDPEHTYSGPRSAWDQVSDLMKDAASELGLMKAVTFFQEVVPVVPRILDELPVAVLYLQRLFRGGLPHGFSGSSSPVANAVHSIIKGTVSAILTTDTGSVVADRVLMEQGVDLTAAASTESWSDLVPLLNQGVWAELASGDDYGPSTVALTTLNIFKSLAVYTLSPYARISLPQVAADIVTASLALAENVVANADTLRFEAAEAYSMQIEEYYAFLNLQNHLTSIKNSLAKLHDGLELTKPKPADEPADVPPSDESADAPPTS
ncbi:hypothetical protein GPECTOR_1g835 [Gonium pectorale]|uniref:Uncharacterized protein n=1 Tax=Gonium pectorale TaxID=33097 RepID=A0A150H477_GONPE|nr:hypothetical protein GPECTOR_1g835 [Gonium pectorale]|eukprot:KXZ56926.1 hypothetical protein GPECTOR_1g835 [Gonium pectorale]